MPLEYHTRVIGVKPPTVKDQVRVLILRKGKLGDIVMTLPLLSALPGHWVKMFLGPIPQSTIVSDLVDEVYDIEDSLLDYSTFDLALNLLYDQDKSISEAILAAGVKTVITPPFLLRAELNVGSLLLGALEPLGITKFDTTPRLPVRFRKRDCRIAIHPSSGASAKNWPLERWVELIKCLDAPVLLISGPADHEVTKQIVTQVKCPIFENQSLKELSERLSGCALFVGHDTGTTHLAAAVGTPTVALFGGTNPQTWGPRGNHVRFITSSTSDNLKDNVFTLSLMENITVETVLNAVTEYYNQVTK